MYHQLKMHDITCTIPYTAIDLHVRVYTICTCVCMYVCVCVCMNVHTCMCVHVHVCVWGCACVSTSCTCTCMCKGERGEQCIVNTQGGGGASPLPPLIV